MKAEYPENRSCPQKDSAEHEEYVGAQSVGCREVAEQDGADLLEKILSRDNLNRAYKRVRANKGAPGIDGMTVEDALPWLREYREKLLDSIRQGKYKPQPVRRKEIPKPDGGVRKLGIPTVIDRIIQQAIAQQLVPIYEPLFSDDSYGYRPNRSAQQAIQKVKWYAEQGYTSAVLVDLSKYFDTRVHAKSLKKAKAKLKELTSRSQGRNVRKVMENVKVYIRGWLGYFGIASMKTTMQRWDEWLRRRIRMYIWKQWKKPKTRAASLIKLGVPKERAWIAARTRKAYWRCAAMPIVQEGLSKEVLARAGCYSIQARYEQVHLCD